VIIAVSRWLNSTFNFFDLTLQAACRCAIHHRLLDLVHGTRNERADRNACASIMLAKALPNRGYSKACAVHEEKNQEVGMAAFHSGRDIKREGDSSRKCESGELASQ